MNAQPPSDQDIAPGARIAPAPAWVQLEDYSIPTAPNPHFIANGLSTLLDEVQVDLCGPERAWFHRRADLVTAHAGAEQAAQFSASYDPAYERVDIHSIKVIRDGQVLNHTDPAKFQVLRREQNLERLIHDGRVTIHYAIPDVRPGDTVETSVTIYGMRKSLAGRHSTWMLFEWSFGIVDLRVRQRAPSHRRIHERRYNGTPEPLIVEVDGVTEKKWRVVNRHPVRAEASAPPWTIQQAAIQFSEWADWGEVVSTFLPLYAEDAPLPADLEQEIQNIEQAETTPEGRAAAVLRLTQTAVRYLAISMGEGGYTPRPLAETWAARYGDCKDKSKLFVAMARRLGLEAYPALVDTRSGYRLNDILPTAEAFDHCIVKVMIGDTSYWLDPTRARQLSPLNALSQCHFGWALPLKDGAVLERMPDPTPVHFMETNERIDLGPTPDDRVRYTWRVTSRRGRAEWVRETIAREGAIGMFKMYAQDVQRAFPLAEPVKQDVENDDPKTNEISIVEEYDLPQAWAELENRAYQFSTLDLAMKSNLAPLQAGMPRHPIYLGQIGKVSRRVEIHMANSMRLDPWERRIEASTLSLANRFSKLGPRTAVLQQELEFRALTLPASEADKYRAICAELDKNDIALRDVVNRKGVFRGMPPAAAPSNGASWIVHLVWIGVVLAYIAFDVLMRRGAWP